MISDRTPRKLLDIMSRSIGEAGLPSPLITGNNPFNVLVSTVISLRTRDAVTGVVARRVLASVSTAEEMSIISQEKLAGLLRPAGFFNRKASQLRRIAEILVREYDGMVPADRNALMALPGVGGKTAAYVLSMAFGIPAICVDIHVHRISNRLGLVKTESPGETEKELMLYFPQDLWIPLNHVFVRFGQRQCLPLRPKCSTCAFKEWCIYVDRCN